MVSEVTRVGPDGTSMVISVAVSMAALAPVSAITLGIKSIRMSEVAQAFVIAVSPSAQDPVWKSIVVELDATFLEE